MSGRLIANAVVFQVGWWVAVLGVARGDQWLSPILVGCLVCLNIGFLADPLPAIRVVLTVGLFGSALDSVLSSAGLLQFVSSPFGSVWCPPWLMALWCLFATTLTGSLRWLAGRTWTSALVGAICGPLSYYAGHHLGALRLGPNQLLSLLVLSLLWAILLPGLLHWTIGSSRTGEAGS